MKYGILLIAAGILQVGIIKAQNLIAVQSGGEPEFYTNINTAIDSASAGDTIYLPGGIFTINNSIVKPIHIIGVGHNPDSTNATYYTYLTGTSYPSGSINLSIEASGGSLTGVYIPGQLFLGNPNGCVNDYSIWRCNIGSLESSVPYSWGCAPSNVSIYECITGIYLPGGSDFIICNSIISLCIGNNNTIKNNIIFGALNAQSASLNNSIFENNIFLGVPFVCYYSNTFYNNLFNNNLFVEDLTFPFQGTNNLGIYNIVNQPLASIFINYAGNGFNYDDSYHLQPSCPGINAGSDGTDIGIYGGMFPWKEGSLPPNPHIQYKQIQQSTDQNGNLNVNIKVAAQDH